MSQSKRESAIEVICSTLLGSVIAWAITYTIIYYVSNIAIASTLSVICCTVASLIRSYFMRRYFVRRSLRLTQYKESK